MHDLSQRTGLRFFGWVHFLGSEGACRRSVSGEDMAAFAFGGSRGGNARRATEAWHLAIWGCMLNLLAFEQVHAKRSRVVLLTMLSLDNTIFSSLLRPVRFELRSADGELWDFPMEAWLAEVLTPNLPFDLHARVATCRTVASLSFFAATCLYHKRHVARLRAIRARVPGGGGSARPAFSPGSS